MQAILKDGWIITDIQKPDVVLEQIDDDYIDMTGILKHAEHDRFNFQEPRRMHLPTNSLICFIEDKDENIEKYELHEYENDYDEDYEEQTIHGVTQKRRRRLFDGW